MVLGELRFCCSMIGRWRWMNLIFSWPVFETKILKRCREISRRAEDAVEGCQFQGDLVPATRWCEVPASIQWLMKCDTCNATLNAILLTSYHNPFAPLQFAESDTGVYRCSATNEYPNRLDLDFKAHEASLAQEVAIGSEWGVERKGDAEGVERKGDTEGWSERRTLRGGAKWGHVITSWGNEEIVGNFWARFHSKFNWKYVIVKLNCEFGSFDIELRKI